MKSQCSICHGNIDTADPPGDKPLQFDHIIACENCMSEAKQNLLEQELKRMEKEKQ